ncbi:hypothetical protein CR513_06914, partial [Mucuna pruriens]
MLDLGASINVMLTSIYKSLNCGDLEPTRMTIQLANRSVVQPLGVLEDVLVRVGELIFPADFYVLDMEDETPGKGSTLILGRPFLMTAKTKIDVHARTLSMEFGDTLVQFNIFEAMKHPVEDTSLFGIDLINELVKEYMQVDTGTTKFFQVAGNTNILDCLRSVFEEPDYDEPWEVHDLSNSTKATTALTHLDPDSNSTDLFDQARKNEKPVCLKHAGVLVVGVTRQQSTQEANIFLENNPAEIGQDWMKTKSMSVTRVDTSAAKEDLEQAEIKAEAESANQHKEQSEAGIMPAIQVPNFNQVSQTISRPIGDDPPPKPPTELKPLSNHLKYAYLGDEQQLLVLRQHKKAIGWKLSDLPGINSSIYMYRILMEEEARSIRQQQRRLNPTILDVVVPKKSGMTIMKNQNDELVPMRVQNSWRIHIAPEDQHKTTFTCPFSTFAYTRMSFGLCNAPSMRFIKNFSKTALPLSKLLQKDMEFVFSKEGIQAFEELKTRLTSTPILQAPK